MFAAAWLFVLSCGGVGAPTPERCEAMGAGAARDECWATVAPQLFADDPARGEQLVEAQVQDQKVKDFIWLTVTREVDPGSGQYCQKIVEPALKRRCMTLVSRPHLHRALQEGGGAGESSPPGAPPAGGGPPPGGQMGGGPMGGGPVGGGPPPQAPRGLPPGQAPPEGPPPGEAAPETTNAPQ
ncbi:MAG: hypothetical protein H6742_20980 [Alphaproteobacteria bacterium]|nr:hypothetical protein [Alphaproteobacteria bacterium]